MNPESDPSKKITLKSRLIILSALLVILIAGGTYLTISNKATSAAYRADVLAALQTKQFEQTLEEARAKAFDAGYQTAIWDIFLNTPLYVVQEDENGVSLWKRQKIDDTASKRLEAKKATP